MGPTDWADMFMEEERASEGLAREEDNSQVRLCQGNRAGMLSLLRCPDHLTPCRTF